MANKSNPQQKRLNRQKPNRDSRGRWLPGSSGNLYGRPKEPDLVGTDANTYVFAETILTLNVNGRPVEMTRDEAIQNKIFQSAMNGDVRAQIFLSKQFDDAKGIMAEAPLHALDLIRRWRQTSDDRVKDDIMNDVSIIQSNLKDTHTLIAIKNRKRKRRR
jgi:hypothetical protein